MIRNSKFWHTFLAIERVIVRFERSMVFVTFVGMSFFVLAGIVARLGSLTIPWTNEAAQLILVWLMFMGANLGTYYREHVGVTLLPDMLHGRARLAVVLFIQLAILVFSLYVLVAGIEFVNLQKMMGGTTFSLPYDIPKYLIALILPISFFAGTIHAIHHLIDLDAPTTGLTDFTGDDDVKNSIGLT
jgi:TRAP-type C4-dicarboxylate transport system permease small subunit